YQPQVDQARAQGDQAGKNKALGGALIGMGVVALLVGMMVLSAKSRPSQAARPASGEQPAMMAGVDNQINFADYKSALAYSTQSQALSAANATTQQASHTAPSPVTPAWAKILGSSLLVLGIGL